MTEFQAGDIVECVKGFADGWTVTGQFYRVESVHGLTGALRVGEQIIIANRFRLAFRPPAGEVWEPWNGGDPPLIVGPTAFTRRVGGNIVSTAWSHMTGDGWTHTGGPADIIAYRITPAEPATAEIEACLADNFVPGDAVLVNSPGKVIAVHGPWAWVEFGGELETVALADLIRAVS